MSLPTELGLLLVGLVGIAALLDLQRGRIPNGLLVVIAGLGLAAAMAVSGPAGGFVMALGGLATGLAIWIGPFALRWVGAADVKLVAAIGAWLGPLATLRLSLAGAVAGGLMSLAYLAATRRWVALEALQVQLMQLRFTRRFVSGSDAAVRQRGMPYAVAILAGLLAEMLIGGW